MGKSCIFDLKQILQFDQMMVTNFFWVTDSAKLAIHTLVTSILDYCNGLLASINKNLLKRLQNIQRTAAS